MISARRASRASAAAVRSRARLTSTSESATVGRARGDRGDADRGRCVFRLDDVDRTDGPSPARPSECERAGRPRSCEAAGPADGCARGGGEGLEAILGRAILSGDCAGDDAIRGARGDPGPEDRGDPFRLRHIQHTQVRGGCTLWHYQERLSAEIIPAGNLRRPCHGISSG